MKNRIQKKSSAFIYPFLGFLIPFSGMLIVTILKLTSCPGASMLFSDMYQQYYPFFTLLHRTLREGSSLFYTWDAGMGMDFLGLIAYYLASPFNFISIFLPDSMVFKYFSILAPLKLGLAGLFFSVFLKELFCKNDFSISVFGGFYALCAWALGYHWDIMWLDTFSVFPLVVLGTVRLIRDKKILLYTLSLFYAIYVNFYIGLFVCIFVFLLFFCYEICCWNGTKRFLQDLLRIAVFSALAISMTACLSLPALSALSAAEAASSTYSEKVASGIVTDLSLRDYLLLMKYTAGNLCSSIEPTFKEGNTNLFCGVGTVFLAILFLFSDKSKKRIRFCGLFLLIFLEISFINPFLNYVWNGFHFANMMPDRFSFLFSFVLLCMAYQAWLHRKEFSILKILLSAAAAMGLFFCNENLLQSRTVDLGIMIIETPVAYLHNTIFLILYAILLITMNYVPRKNAADSEQAQEPALPSYKKQKRFNFCFFLLGIAELVLILEGFHHYYMGVNLENYPAGKEDTAAVLRQMEAQTDNPLFYRVEAASYQTANDGPLNGYHGVSAFTSTVNQNLTNFMTALGFNAEDASNIYIFQNTSPVANLFINLKYMLDRENKVPPSPWFTDIFHSGDVHLLQNNVYLPLGFLAEEGLQDLVISRDSNKFDFQNQLLAAASGLDHPIWNLVPEDAYQLSSDQVTVHKLPQGREMFSTDESIGIQVQISSPWERGRMFYEDAEKGDTINCRFSANAEGFLCLGLNLPDETFYSVSVNGEEIWEEETYLPQVSAVGSVKPGDQIDILLRLPENPGMYLSVEAAIMDEAAFLESYHVLKQSTLEITSFQPTHLEGKINCSRNGLLYTSIPQNGFWKTYVDGEEVQPVLLGNCMLSLPLTEGTHTVSFRYSNTSFYIGCTVTILCLAILLVYVWMQKRHVQKSLPEYKENHA